MHVRNSLAGLRALGRCVGNEADTEQERSGCVVEEEWNTRLERIERAALSPPLGVQGDNKKYRGGLALDSLSGAQRRIRSHSQCRPCTKCGGGSLPASR